MDISCYHPLHPEFLGPGKVVALAPLGGSTELVKKRWQGSPVLALLPYPGSWQSPERSKFPTGAFRHLFLIALASWHQTLDLLTLLSAILLFLCSLPLFLPGVHSGSPSRK